MSAVEWTVFNVVRFSGIDDLPQIQRGFGWGGGFGTPVVSYAPRPWSYCWKGTRNAMTGKGYIVGMVLIVSK